MDKSLLYPLFAQVWMTFIIAILTLRARIRAYKTGEVQIPYFKHNRGKAPEYMLRWGDNLQNQFELPVLFYLLMVLLLITQTSGLFYVVMAWLFVISRLVHVFIHIRSNHIGQRRDSFVFGFFTLLLMWLSYTVEILI